MPEDPQWAEISVGERYNWIDELVWDDTSIWTDGSPWAEIVLGAVAG